MKMRQCAEYFFDSEPGKASGIICVEKEKDLFSVKLFEIFNSEEKNDIGEKAEASAWDRNAIILNFSNVESIDIIIRKLNELKELA